MAMDLAAIQSLIPKERLRRFRHPSDPGDVALLFRYRNHLVESSEIWVWINLVETALATSLKRELAHLYGPGWLKNPQFRKALGNDLSAFIRNGAVKQSRLTFGFWTMLLQDNREKTLWVPALHKGFVAGTNRSQIYKHARDIRLIRNKLAHHELLPDESREDLKQAIRGLSNALADGFAEFVITEGA